MRLLGGAWRVKITFRRSRNVQEMRHPNRRRLLRIFLATRRMVKNVDHAGSGDDTR